MRSGHDREYPPNIARLTNDWHAPCTRFRAGHKIHGWGVSRQNLATALGIQGHHSRVILISEPERFAAVVYWTNRCIKNCHFSPDFFQHKQRSVPPDLAII